MEKTKIYINNVKTLPKKFVYIAPNLITYKLIINWMKKLEIWNIVKLFWVIHLFNFNYLIRVEIIKVVKYKSTVLRLRTIMFHHGIFLLFNNNFWKSKYKCRHVINYIIPDVFVYLTMHWSVYPLKIKSTYLQVFWLGY